MRLNEVKGLGTGMGAAGAAVSKAAGAPGVDLSSGNTKALAPQDEQAAEEEAPAQEEAPPEEEMAPEEQGPEMEEKLPKPEKLRKDKYGAPDKEYLKGHEVKYDGRKYVLSKDDEFNVYKLVDPDSKIVRTRVRPQSVSTLDFRESIESALDAIHYGVPVDYVVDGLLES